MKTTQLEIIFSAILMLFLSSCNPAKLSSNFNVNTQTKSTTPEKEAIDVEKQLSLFADAISKLGQTSALLSINDAANTSWTYLGYRVQLSTTDGRGSVSNVLSRTKTTLSFSDVRQEQCPTGMYCIQVYQPYVETKLSTLCQKATYRMAENIVMTASMAPVSNYRWTVVSGEKTPDCENEDSNFFTTLGNQIIQDDPLVFVSGDFLFIQSSSMTYIFSK